MNSVELIEALKSLVQEKGINEDAIFNALESALVAAYRKNYGTSQNVKVTINRQTGEIHVYAQKKVVEDVYDNLLEISLEDAKDIDVRYELDDVVDIEITPKDFLRVKKTSSKTKSSSRN